MKHVQECDLTVLLTHHHQYCVQKLYHLWYKEQPKYTGNLKIQKKKENIIKFYDLSHYTDAIKCPPSECSYVAYLDLLLEDWELCTSVLCCHLTVVIKYWYICTVLPPDCCYKVQVHVAVYICTALPPDCCYKVQVHVAVYICTVLPPDCCYKVLVHVAVLSALCCHLTVVIKYWYMLQCYLYCAATWLLL